MNQPLLKCIDYVEVYVFNAFQAANFYRSAFGFDIVAYSGPETGINDQVSYFLRQNFINMLITSSLNRESPLLKHVINHDDSIRDIAFLTNNVGKMYEKAIKAGATPILEPTDILDSKTRITKATIATFGNTVHSFIEREDSSHNLPFYKPLNYSSNKFSLGLENIDHIAIAIKTGELEKWKKFYENVLGFHVFYSEDVYTNDSGMKSVVVTDPTETIKFVLVEGVTKKKKSQIENYITYNGCSGVQHLAFLARDIIKAANTLQQNGIKFLEIPNTYYDSIPSELKKTLHNKIEALQHSNILIDQEDNGYLMQMFTRPLQNLPTFFIEIVQRENSIGFGSNNIKALYEAVEKDQRKAMIDA